MALNDVYNYQFERIAEPEGNLFHEEWAKVDTEQMFANRQTLLTELLTEDFKKKNIVFTGKERGKDKVRKTYEHIQIYTPSNGVFVMRIANEVSRIRTRKNFSTEKQKDYPNCVIIIDNRIGIQRILIEVKSSAFKETKMVAEIIEYTLSRLLEKFHLRLRLYPVFQNRRFWDVVKKYSKGFYSVVFRFPPLNLERISKEIDETVFEMRQAWSSGLELKLGTPQNPVLIDENNKLQKQLVKCASASGNAITLYPRGRDQKKIVIDGNDAHAQVSAPDSLFDSLQAGEIFDDPLESRMNAFLDSIPNIF